MHTTHNKVHVGWAFSHLCVIRSNEDRCWHLWFCWSLMKPFHLGPPQFKHFITANSRSFFFRKNPTAPLCVEREDEVACSLFSVFVFLCVFSAALYRHHREWRAAHTSTYSRYGNSFVCFTWFLRGNNLLTSLTVHFCLFLISQKYFKYFLLWLQLMIWIWPKKETRQSNSYKAGNCVLKNVAYPDLSLCFLSFLCWHQVSRAPARWSSWPSITRAGLCSWRAHSLCGWGRPVCTTTSSELTHYHLKRRWKTLYDHQLL